MNILSKLLGDPNKKEISSMKPLIDAINALEPEYEKLTGSQLKEKTQEFKKRVSRGESLDDILVEAFALVRQAAKQVLKQRHYDVQLLAGITLHRGQITEMKTGEGKTLVATLPLYLNALTGKGAHLITVNDYLAKLHATWMGEIYYALGMSVSCIQQQGASYLYDPQQEDDQGESEDSKVTVDMKDLRSVSRREAYAADITYGTNNEFGFDYLRDNMAQRLEDQSQRGLAYAIVDEVDSILIDEARTPLIISAPAQEATEMYVQFARLVPQLSEGEDYNIDEKMRAATLTEEGIHKVEKKLGIENLYAEGGMKKVHHLEQALKAHAIFRRDKDYVVRDDEVIIVDEFTGRLMHGRRYSEGLHQAIEAKEGVKIKQESITMATITFQNYFRLYEKLSGMTGTAKTEEEEFAKIYGLSVLEIPTNRPIARKDAQDKIYKSEVDKFNAVIKEVKEKNEKGQPVLIGTVSIEKNERLSSALTKAGIKHELLNAKNHEREAEIIAQAGRPGAVTLATNMAGRGVDIILGGNPPDEEVSTSVKHAGGLHVIGTERHESRRIDNQLRGRSGRQGDPGSSVFFVSMEDDLMRIFGSERMKTVMERLGVPSDMPIENKLISKSIESAQKKVEGHNFDARKHIVQYDDVINKHRTTIYRMRQAILNLSDKDEDEKDSAAGEKKTNKDRILEMIEQEIRDVVMFHAHAEKQSEWDLDEIYEVIDTIVPMPIDVRLTLEDIHEQTTEESKKQSGQEILIAYIIKRMHEAYAHLEEQFASQEEYGGVKALRMIESMILLRSIDTLWVEHLDVMDHLRTGIGLRGYGQRDPLVEYKKEAYRMFNELQASIRKQVAYSMFKITVTQKVGEEPESQQLRFSGAEKTLDKGHGQFASLSGTGPSASGAQDSTVSGSTPVSSTVSRFAKKQTGVKEAPVEQALAHHPAKGKKVGRNNPCPCGAINPATGEIYKYKKCGLVNASHHKG